MAEKESKSEKFTRIAERRVNETLRALRLLGNLADRRNYEYTDEQASMVLSAIDNEYRALRARFKTESSAGSAVFKFKK